MWSDEWAAYAGLNAIGYVHQTVNHCVHYVDPAIDVYRKTTSRLDGRRASQALNGDMVLHATFCPRTLTNTCGAVIMVGHMYFLLWSMPFVGNILCEYM